MSVWLHHKRTEGHKVGPMGYSLITYDEPEDFVEVANLLKLGIYRETTGALRDRLWFMLTNEGTVSVHETLDMVERIDDAVKGYRVAIPILRGKFEWVK